MKISSKYIRKIVCVFVFKIVYESSVIESVSQQLLKNNVYTKHLIWIMLFNLTVSKERERKYHTFLNGTTSVIKGFIAQDIDNVVDL